MEDDLKKIRNGRRPPKNWKMTSKKKWKTPKKKRKMNNKKMEDDLKKIKMKDDLKKSNGRRNNQPKST